MIIAKDVSTTIEQTDNGGSFLLYSIFQCFYAPVDTFLQFTDGALQCSAFIK
jgi:hypothetical protein